MSKDKIHFVNFNVSVDISPSIVKITNTSLCRLIVYKRPIPPKRKETILTVVPPNSFVIFDLMEREKVDITKLYFRFEDKQNE